MPRLTITFESNSGREHQLPGEYVVCERCEGHGTHLHPAIGGHAYTVEEFRETFDEDEAGEYFKRGGIYDVPCEVCGGARVVVEVDEPAALAERGGRRRLLLYRHHQDQITRLRADEAAERRYLARLHGDS